MTKREIFSEREIISLPASEIDGLILIGEPIIVRVGSASILGAFRIEENRLVIELAQIVGGGEGILIALSSLGRRFASLRGLTEIEWLVHAVSCAIPNLKLRRVLEMRGFEVKDHPKIGTVYYFLDRCN